MTDRDPLRGDALTDALAEAFDSVAPHDRAAAEAELRERGDDPRHVGQRSRALAQQSAHRAAPGEGKRASAEDSSPLWRAPLFRLAAGIILAIGVGWWATARTSPGERVVARPLAPHARVPPPRLAAAAPGVTAQSDSGQRAIVDTHATKAPTRSYTPAPFEANAASNNADDPDAEGAAADIGQPHRKAWRLDGGTLARAKGHLPPSVQSWVSSGNMSFRVVPTAADALHDNYPPSFWAATEANGERYFVDPATCALGDRQTGRMAPPVTGLPFPTVTADGDGAACEIMWNVEAAAALSGPRSATWSLEVFSGKEKERSLTLSIQSMPSLAAHVTRDGYAVRASRRLRVVSEGDTRGASALTVRQVDAPDSSWMYLPALKRVRRLSPEARSDTFLGTGFALDDFDCFDARLEDFIWTIVGRADVLAPMLSPTPLLLEPLSETSAQLLLPALEAGFKRPVDPQQKDLGAPWSVDRVVLTQRPAWIVEGKPRSAQYVSGRLRFYIDAELYRPYWKEAFDRVGEPRATAMCSQYWARSRDGARAAVGTDPLLIVDSQLQSTALLRVITGEAFDEKMPADWFTVGGMIEAAR